MSGRISRFLLAAAVLASTGCVGREALSIPPSTMASTGSPLVSKEGDTTLTRENASLSSRVKFRSVGRWALVIQAAGRQAADGQWPRMRVTIGEVSYGAITIDREGRARYWVNFAAEPGFADIRLALLNGDPSRRGPALTIDRVEILPL